MIYMFQYFRKSRHFKNTKMLPQKIFVLTIIYKLLIFKILISLYMYKSMDTKESTSESVCPKRGVVAMEDRLHETGGP